MEVNGDCVHDSLLSFDQSVTLVIGVTLFPVMLLQSIHPYDDFSVDNGHSFGLFPKTRS